MKPEKWIKKNASCPTIAAQAIDLFNKRIDIYKSYDNEMKQSYIIKVKDDFQWSEIFYNEKYALSEKAFLKYYSKY